MLTGAIFFFALGWATGGSGIPDYSYNRFTFVGNGYCTGSVAGTSQRFARREIDARRLQWTEADCIKKCRSYADCVAAEWTDAIKLCGVLSNPTVTLPMNPRKFPPIAGTATAPPTAVVSVSASQPAKCWKKDASPDYDRFTFIGDGACINGGGVTFTQVKKNAVRNAWVESDCVDYCRNWVACVGVNWEVETKMCSLLSNSGTTLPITSFPTVVGAANAPATGVLVGDQDTTCIMKETVPDYVAMRFVGDGYCNSRNRRYKRYERNQSRYHWTEAACIAQCHKLLGCRGVEWVKTTQVCGLLVFADETLRLNRNHLLITGTATRVPAGVVQPATNSATCFWKEIADYNRFTLIGVGNCIQNNQRFSRKEFNFRRWARTEADCINQCSRYIDCVGIEWVEKGYTNCKLLANAGASWTTITGAAQAPGTPAVTVESTTGVNGIANTDTNGVATVAGPIAICRMKDAAEEYSRFRFIGDGACATRGTQRFQRNEMDVRRYPWTQETCINNCRKWNDCIGIEWAPEAIKQCSLLTKPTITIPLNRRFGPSTPGTATYPAAGVLVNFGDAQTTCYMKNVATEYFAFTFIGDGVCAYGNERYTHYMNRQRHTELECVKYCHSKPGCRGVEWVPDSRNLPPRSLNLPGTCRLLLFAGETLIVNRHNNLLTTDVATRNPTRALVDEDHPTTCYWKNDVTEYPRFTHIGDGFCKDGSGNRFTRALNRNGIRYHWTQATCVEQCRTRTDCIGMEWNAQQGYCSLLSAPGTTIVLNRHQWTRTADQGNAPATTVESVADLTGPVSTCYMKNPAVDYVGYSFIGDGVCVNRRNERFTRSVANVRRNGWTEQDCVQKCSDVRRCVGLEWSEEASTCTLLSDSGFTLVLNRHNWLRTADVANAPAVRALNNAPDPPVTCYMRDHSLTLQTRLGGLTQQQIQRSGCSIGAAIGQGCNVHVLRMTAAELTGRRRTGETTWIVTYRVDVSSASGAVALLESLESDADRVQAQIRSQLSTDLGVTVEVGEVAVDLEDSEATMAALEDPPAPNAETSKDLTGLWVSITALASIGVGVAAGMAWSRSGSKPAAPASNTDDNLKWQTDDKPTHATSARGSMLA